MSKRLPENHAENVDRVRACSTDERVDADDALSMDGRVNVDNASPGDEGVNANDARSVDEAVIKKDSHKGDERVNQNGALSAEEAGASFRTWWLSGIIYVLFTLLKWTWRKSEDSFPAEIQKRLEEKKPVLVAHWHEDEWALLGLWTNRGAHTLVSLSKDGGAMTRFLELNGWKISRGSSSKGGATGLLSLIKSVKKSQNPLVTMAVDGPRGPRRRAKKGILKLAVTLKAPVLVMASAASHRFVFKKSWSQAYLPLPFSRVKIVYPKFLTAEEIEKALSKDDDAETIYKLEESLKLAKKLAVETLNA